MGNKSKKKKRGGGGGSSRKSKDYASNSGDESDIIAEELTVLTATYQDDLKILSKSPPKVTIYIRPYSRDTGFEDLDTSVILSVRYVPGYPFKCPKLQITPEKGLSEADAHNLLSLLHDQANLDAREGRVMIFNLVEAAKEFLSEIIPVGLPMEPLRGATVEKRDQLADQDMEASWDKSHCFRGPFVYGLVDLFIGYKESWDLDHGTDKTRSRNSLVQAHSLDVLNTGHQPSEKKIFHNEKSLALQDAKQSSVQPFFKLGSLKEESEGDSQSTSSDDSGRSAAEESLACDLILEEQQGFELQEQMSKIHDGGFEDKSSMVSDSVLHDQTSCAMKKDLIMVHLLRLACAAKGPLSDSLEEITSELYSLGIFSDGAKDLAAKPPSLFKEVFVRSFREHMVSSPNHQFWDDNSEFGALSGTLPNSRYWSDFEELSSLGHGGFGHVALCKNKLDGRQYAVKKIPLKDKSPPINDRILREVATLSRLQHQHVVRYYQAWVETEVGGGYSDLTWGSSVASSSTYSLKGSSSAYGVGPDNKLESTYLYIQMEYCPRTLRQVFESYSTIFAKELAWHLFRQIVEGLAHIHAQGIIHRDLTPSNIFFDARNDIKIGDFGLAKFSRLEQLDHDLNPTDATGISVDGTGQVGTYFYTAPEIEQEWPKINEKADMYSLGVVFLELWYPFETAMERHIVLSDLKQKGSIPPSWATEFPEQATLLQRLMSPSPSNRPTAIELLQNDLPPRMEDEWLDDVLRAIKSPEDTRVYEKVVRKIFDEERLALKVLRHGVKLNSTKDDSLSSQYTEIETEMRDHVVEVAKDTFKQHCAKRMEITPLYLLDDCQQFNRNAVKLLSDDGDMLELCHEMRLPFVKWIITNQKLSFRRYEISWVYRRAIGHSTPNRFLQGDFDIVGGASAITEAETIKVAMDIITCFLPLNSCHIRLNHAHLLDAIWSWVGIEAEHRESVAQCLSVMGSLLPQSSARKSIWAFIRRQLLQDLNLAEGVVNRLQTVDSRFCGYADHTLPRLMGALPPDKNTRKAIEELTTLFGYLRTWKIEKNVFIDALMPPTEKYHWGLFCQIFSDGTLLAVGGRYDHLIHQMWYSEYRSIPPGAVGISLALETIIHCSSIENKPSRNEANIEVLICSRGGGGMLKERMELVSELWESNIKAALVPVPEPSLTEQYEYADDHGIKCLIIITEAGLSQTGSIKVRHLELKKEKEVQRENLAEFLMNAAMTQFRNIYPWN